ncbi:GTPase activating protein-like protein [Xylogone sp. PMI_703]|nr:GTPase activating protein-like protein [Xylogone sp. PMI_703]
MEKEEQQQAVNRRVEQMSSQVQHDSMVTVRLSEPPALTVDTTVVNKVARMDEDRSAEEDVRDTPATIMTDLEDRSPKDTAGSVSPNVVDAELSRESEDSEGVEDEVNWEQLEKTEEKEPKNQDSDDSTALLLARLEQENNLLVTNPKSGLANVKPTVKQRARGQSRPPSMQHLKRLVHGPTPPALRYSMIPPPPLTDLEFYAALVQDYSRTAQYLPTLLSKKIRSGIPPPLRGVVWQSMSGARDTLLEEQFERLCGESSPYEGIIGKDLGRSFPGVEMFRDPDGDGQRMLGRVLKCFSLYDTKIGYCQGLGFLVGPLLMHMGDKQAFCVLVRLMEHYDLRSCFLPDLSGLHVRIYQFRELLKQHLPDLSQHLDALQIEPGYVSQWFLSFFAVTCPLPMLFRIYDVIFAEGASETIMRVALSLMRKNEEKILACTEFEDVMQLLLSRGLWDCYHYNADEFVNDFVSLTGTVTREALRALEQRYRESRTEAASPTDVGSAAARFLGRLWAGSVASGRGLSPGLTASSRPVSFLRRSPSKQSIASTLNSVEGSGTDSTVSLASTDATSISRDSNVDNSSLRTQSVAFPQKMSSGNKDKNLHGQIEDLLTALSELQRDHAILKNNLEREREEREEDRLAVRALLDGLRKKVSSETIVSTSTDDSVATVTPSNHKQSEEDDESAVDDEDEAEDKETETDEQLSPVSPTATDAKAIQGSISEKELSELLDVVEERFSATSKKRRSSMLLSKSQLREELIRRKEQLVTEASKSREFTKRIADQDQEISNLQDQLKESHVHIRNAHAEKQRLERIVQELKARNSMQDSSRDYESEWPTRKSSTTTGLRELKLGRSNSNNSNRPQAPAFNKRTSSLSATAVITMSEGEISPIRDNSENDALVLELVQAKTAEAVAKQEAEEAKAKLEGLRKMLGMSMSMLEVGPPGSNLGHKPSPSQSTIEKGFVSYLTRSNTELGKVAGTAAPAAGGFWGWGKKTASAE